MEDAKAPEAVQACLSPKETICRALDEYKRRTNKPWSVIALETGEFLEDGIPAETLSRISLAFSKPGHRNAVGSLTWGQLDALSKMLNIEIRPTGAKPADVCYFDPMLNPAQVSQLLEIRKKHEANASLLSGYATFLPCSLETPAFMRAHHEAIHRSALGTTLKERDALVETYNRFGAVSQERFASPERSFVFRHLMYAKHLKSIARGTGIYSNLSTKIRKECLSNLIRLLRSPEMKVEMKVAVRPIAALDSYLEGADSWFVVGRALAVWRTKWGSIYWAEHGRKLEWICEMLAAFESRAEMKTNEEVAEFLKGEMAHCHEGESDDIHTRRNRRDRGRTGRSVR